jgi:acetyltransferase-like isoleucine patch superfamily enzyme
VRLRSLATFAYRYSSPTKIFRAFRYPGIRISGGVRLDIRGRLAYGAGCTIGVGSNLIVGNNATLALGRECAIGRYAELAADGLIEIGNETSIQDRSMLLGDVTVGSYCSLAPNVFISSGSHCFDLDPRELIKDQDRMAAQDQGYSAKRSRRVTVEDDCWLGINSVVTPGVTIGKGAVVGANSVVTKDVPPYCVVVGAPARVLRKRLEFVPPGRIDAARPEDRPYFYSGFEVSRNAVRHLHDTGGIAASGAFAIALDASAGDSLHMIVRSAAPGVATVTFGGQRSDVPAAYSEVAFELEPRAAGLMRFHAGGRNGPAKIFLQRAWIK